MPDANGNMTWQDLMNSSSGMGGYPSTMDYTDTSVADSAAKNAYYNAQANNLGQTQALAAAQQAWSQAYQTAQLSGYFGAGVGNGTVAGQATMPNIQYTTGEFGQYYPGGFNSVSPGTQTQAAMQNAQQYGLSQAGVTGVYYDPGNMTYKPGTFVRDPTTNAIGQIQSNGKLQIFGDQGDFLRAGGNWDMVNNPDMMRNVSTSEFQGLANSGQGAGTASTQLQQMYGTYGVPNAGDPTMALQAMYGSNAAPTAGQQTLGAQQQYWNQGFQQSQADISQQNWQAAFNAQQGQNTQQNTLAYLQQLAALRGPADWAKYQQVLGATPQGMSDLYAAAMGQYVPGGGATTGVNPQAASLQTMQQQIAGAGYGQQGGGQLQSGYYPYTTQQNQAQGAYRDASMPNGGNTGQTGNQMWGSGIGIGQQGATGAQQVQATGNGTNMMGGQQQQYNLPAPNQISAQSWGNMAPSQQQMLLGMYEANGWDKNDVTALYNQSLPKYGSNNASAGTWRLQ